MANKKRVKKKRSFIERVGAGFTESLKPKAERNVGKISDRGDRMSARRKRKKYK